MTDLIAELRQECRALEEQHPLFRMSPHWYRGQADAEWSLLPSALRDPFLDIAASQIEAQRFGFDRAFAGRAFETKVNDTFRTRAASLLDNATDLRMVYMEARHAQLPSRLLDWTTNPLIALLFSCLYEPGKDGVVYVLNPNSQYYFETPDSEGYALTPIPDDHPVFGKMIGNLFSPKTREDAARPLVTPSDGLASLLLAQTGDPAPEASLRGVLPVLPMQRSTRIAAQRSGFTFHPTGVDGHIPESHLDTFDVPAATKQETLRDLRLLGIDEGTVWPDLDGTARAIRSSLGLL